MAEIIVTQEDKARAKPIALKVMIGELTAEDLHEAFALHRLATIEECAKVCDDHRNDYEMRAKSQGHTRNERSRCSHYAQALAELATALRSLSSQRGEG